MYVDNLPSRQAYGTFKDGLNDCSVHNIEVGNTVTTLQSALDGHPHLQNEVDKILKAYCYATSHGGSYGTNCTFFYYWLGSKIWQNEQNINDSDSFQNVINNIYGELGKITINGEKGKGCSIINEKYEISKDLFPNARTLSDYSLDYTTISNNLTKKNNDNTYCLAYKPYLDNAATAYTKLCEEKNVWGSETNTLKGSVCGDFIARAGGDKNKLNPQELLDQHCPSSSELQTEPGTVAAAVTETKTFPVQTLEGKTSSPSGVNIPSVSAAGGLATIGIPALAYFFYKYKSHLFHSFFNKHNHSGSGRSTRKRSLERNLDILMEDSTTADTSTFDSSETSSTTNDDSTFDSTTVYSSVPYTTTASKRTRSAQQQQRQGGQRHNRNNISYHSM
ncbi:KIR protein [Plasmodium coatneyi]|uniref:KIR protein n=1 Tax=Plasmodium coatneyi TaxID=208452 RepID=A0A1B1DVZ2_9APIC|nr:KIR protein [Plasmodium coatneyi]ANQ06938.1 KIR protein [Plasmodium coatneyi]